MSKNKSEIGANSDNNIVCTGNTTNKFANCTINYYSKDSENKEIISKKRTKTITYLIILIILLSALSIISFFVSREFSQKNEISPTISKEHYDNNLTKAEILTLYKNAQKAYNDWIPQARSEFIDLDKPTTIQTDVFDQTYKMYPIVHDTIKTFSDLKDYFSNFFLANSEIFQQIQCTYVDINGKLYGHYGDMGDGGFLLISFNINRIDYNKIELIFTYIIDDQNNDLNHPFQAKITMIYGNNKWLFTDDFDPSIILDDPIITDNNVTLRKIADEYIVMYDDSRLGTVNKTDGLPLLYSPESTSDNNICVIEDKTRIKVLGYDRYKINYLYVEYGDKRGYVCSYDKNGTYVIYRK